MQKLALIALALLLAACGSTDAQITPETDPLAPKTDQQALTIERLYASPSLSGSSPRGVKFSPDGQRVTFPESPRG